METIWLGRKKEKEHYIYNVLFPSLKIKHPGYLFEMAE